MIRYYIVYLCNQMKLWNNKVKILRALAAVYMQNNEKCLDKYFVIICDLSIFGRPFVKRFALCYRTVVCHVCLSCLSVSYLSVTLVYCGQKVGWIKMPLDTEVGLGQGDIVHH